MRLKTWWLGLVTPALAVVVATGACSSDDGETGAGGTDPGERKNTGEACSANDQCVGSLCLTSETFASLSEGKEADIPGGYCSSFDCTKNSPSPEQCGPDGFCFDLEPYAEAPIWACFELCESDTDCRDGYACADAAGSTYYPPLPHKACIAPDLLCLLEVCEYCDEGCGSGGGGTGGSGTGGSATGGSSTGGSGTGGAGGG